MSLGMKFRPTQTKLFLSSRHLKGAPQHYKMTIGFCHQVTWNGGCGNVPTFPYQIQRTVWSGGFWKPMLLGYKMKFGFNSFSFERQIPLLQNEFWIVIFFHVPKQWNITKWDSQPFTTKCRAQLQGRPFCKLERECAFRGFLQICPSFISDDLP